MVLLLFFSPRQTSWRVIFSVWKCLSLTQFHCTWKSRPLCLQNFSHPTTAVQDLLMLLDCICIFSGCFQKDSNTPTVLKPHLNVANESFFFHASCSTLSWFYNVWTNGFLRSRKLYPIICVLFPCHLIFSSLNFSSV